jgi:hypothetical protein
MILENIELSFEDTIIPTEVETHPDKWFERPLNEKISILDELSNLLYGSIDDDNGIINIDLNDPETLG